MSAFKIKKGARTANHKETLSAINTKLKREAYKVEDKGEFLLVTAEGGLINDVTSESDKSEDLNAAVLEQVVKKGGMLSYQSQVTYKKEDGTTGRLFGIPLCGKLGVLSALIGKPDNGTAKKNGASLDSVLSIL